MNAFKCNKMTSRISFLFSILGFLFLINPLIAQNQQYVFEHISIDNGLSHNSVYSIIQDREGFMWFGSEDGLNRYDGYEFVIFRHDPSNENSLSSSNFGKILQDSEGIFWFATWGSGLNRYDPIRREFKHYQHKDDDSTSLSSNRIEFIFQDSDSTFWLGTNENGLEYFNKNTGVFTHYVNIPGDNSSIADNHLKAIMQPKLSKKSELWFGTDKGISILDKETGKFRQILHEDENPNSLSNNKIRAITEDNDGMIWIGTRGGGVNVLNNLDGKIKHYTYDPAIKGSLSENSITCIFKDSDGHIWIGTYRGGLNKYNKESDSFQHWAFEPQSVFGLSHDRVETIYEDRSKVLWIGTRGGGVNKLDLKKKNFEMFFYDPDNNGLPNPSVNAICTDNRNDLRIYLGTDGAGLSIFNRNNYTFKNHAQGMYSSRAFGGQRIWSLLMDSKHTLWAGSYADGLVAAFFNKKGIRVRHFGDNEDDDLRLSNSTIHTIFENTDGSIWVGTPDGIDIIQYNSEKKPIVTKSFKNIENDKNSISNNFINSITSDHNGLIWIGTLTGLNIFYPKREIFRLLHSHSTGENSISNDNINVVFESSHHPGLMWVGTVEGGLNKLDTQFEGDSLKVLKITRYTESDGLSNNTIRAILDDDKGNLWVSTAQGLNKVDPIDGKIQIYDIGILFKNQNFIHNSAFRTKDGELFFGSTNGFIKFRPSKLAENPYKPTVALTEFKIHNKHFDIPVSYYEKKEIFLNYDQNYLSFSFSALEYTNSEKNKYAYKLSGTDNDWVYLKKKRDAVYSSLDPGEYIFRVKAANNDGVWNEDGMEIRILILPPWWATIWARILFIGIIVIISVSFFRIRLQQITKRNILLSENEQKYRQVVENSNDAIRIISEGKIVFLNRSAKRIFGYSLEEMINMDFYSIIHQKDSESLRKIDALWDEGQDIPHNYQFRIIDKSGLVKWIESNRVWITLNKKPSTLIFDRDITAQVSLERRLQIAHRMEAIGTLAGGIAHDFNNVLSPIIGFSELILEKPGDKNFVKECSDYILKAAQRATDLVRQILAFSHSSEQEKNSVSLPDVIKEAAKLLRAAMPTSIEIDLNLEETLKPVYADATQIHQVIMNLGTNAYHAMRDKGGKLTIGLNSKTLNPADIREYPSLQPGEYAQITVEDTGVGMKKEILEKIYEPFFTTRKIGAGTGMGLAVVHGIVDNHSGIIDVYSEPGKGSSFKILLPCLVDGDMRAQEQHNKIIRGNGENILVVDDESPILELLKKQLSDINYNPIAFVDSNEALEIFREEPAKFSAVITDQNMPGLRGDQLCRELQKIVKDVPLIMCTGFSEHVDSETAKELGINEFLFKPVMKWELSFALDRVLHPNKSAV